MENEFAPENDLESALLKARQGELSRADLLSFLINQEVVVLSQSLVMNEDPDKTPQAKDPLAVDGPNREKQIAAFSSMGRAKEKQKTRPEFEYATVFQCGELIRNLSKGVGLSLNPGMSMGLVFDSIYINQLQLILSKKTEADGTVRFVFDEIFAPENNLESVLLKAQIEDSPLTSILPAILNSDLVVLAKGSNVEDPLFVSRSDGANLLATYTSVSRTAEKQKENPDYKFAAEVKCGALLLGLPEGAGLIINPGLNVGMTLTPEVVGKIRSKIKSD